MSFQFLRINDMRIGTKLAIGFSLVLSILVILSAIGVARVGTINEKLRIISEVNGVKQRYAINFRGSVHNRAIALRDVVLETDATAVHKQLDLIKQLESDYSRSAMPLDSMFADASMVTDDERSALANIKSVELRSVPVIQKVIDLRNSGYVKESQMLLLSEARPIYAAWLDSINVLIDLEEKMNQTQSLSARSAADSFATLMIALTISAILLIAGVAWGITRSIVRPISRAVSIAETVARGDLTSEIDVIGKDETSQLLRALRNMNERLVDVVSRVRASSESIATGSAQIAAGNTDLSQRTEEQAASLEETAASMEELTATVKQNTENARQGNTLASSASEIAMRGGDVVGKVVGTMHDISSSSAKVAEIISVIEGIAFQTNILALNAAVEAARAGEQGRGFAVVASEVRSLAQRSATAAKEIKELIDQSVSKVETGTALVDGAGATMTEVLQSVKRVTDLMGKIMSASIEQHTGIEQVNQAVMQMDEVTQQNAALVEEASAAAQSMAAQSSTLRELVAVFRLPANGAEYVQPIQRPHALLIGSVRVKTGTKQVPSTPRVLARVGTLPTSDWQSF